MTLLLELSGNQEAALKAKPQAQGISAEEYAKQVLAHELEAAAPEPFWKAFSRRMESLPDEVFSCLPEDGATEHGHYLYGSPKKNQ